jgi:endonuclease I
MRLTPALLLLLAGPLATLSAQAPPGYYAGVDTSSGAALRASLHALIDDHQRFPFTSTSTDTWDILEAADTNPADPGTILDLYRNAAYPKAGGGNSFYDREHSWPSSYGFPDDNASNYPFSDCHALFLCDSLYNSERGNKPFRNCNPSCAEKTTLNTNGTGGGSGTYPGFSNWTNGFGTPGTWEAWSGRRGDVARALLYMDLRYEGGSHGLTGAAEPDLILTDDESLIAASNTGSNLSVAYMGMRSVLLQWHQQDPPDAKEVERNDAVFAFQGNRNPFIDNPQWVAIVYGTGAPSGANVWINELHYDNNGADLNEAVEVAGQAGLSLAGYKLVAYNGSDGASYASLDLSGSLPDQGNCLGVMSFLFPGLQNGSPDGLALVDPLGVPIEFLSYEGIILATSGPAIGLTSVDIGVSESSVGSEFESLQKVGSGKVSGDFTWSGPTLSTFGVASVGQTFQDACGGVQLPPAPSGLSAQTCVGKVALSWSPVATPALVGYEVYRSNSPGGPYTKLTPGPIAATTFLDTGVLPGTRFYAVSSVVSPALEGLKSADLQVQVLPSGALAAPWINELHYDNSGTDVGEFVEVAGPAGLNLAGYQLVAYNGTGGASYQTVNLSGLLPDLGGCAGALSFPFAGLQNGSPDGLALVGPGGVVLEFLSYEGSFVAVGGPANGLLSSDIGVQEPTTTPIGQSLQRQGSGSSASAFASWAGPAAQSPGAANLGQTFQGGCPGSVLAYGCSINPPGSLLYLGGALTPGSSLSFGLDDPLDVVPSGALCLLSLSFGATPNFPCGLPLPGYGLAGPSALGELLLDLSPALTPLPILVGSPWVAGGPPVALALNVPFNCALVGATFYLQGAFVDAFGPYGIGLTEALRVSLAP